jgi:hypothetical protein
MTCESCHEDGAIFTPLSGNKPARRYVTAVTFPYVDGPISTTGTPATTIPSTQAQITAVTILNGAKGTAAQDDAFVCMTCHRARESTLTLDAGDVGGLVTTFTLSAKSAHYLSAGATLYGSRAAVMYQYPGRTYVQRWDHDRAYTTPYTQVSGVSTTPASAKANCTYCHMQDGSHAFEVEVGPTTACALCHTATTVDDLTPFGRAEDNFDGDPTTKPKAETAAFAARLLTTIENYAKAATTAGTTGAQWTLFYPGDNPLSTASRTFYKDLDHSGVLELSELTSANAIKWDSKGYRAAYNYRYPVVEPGAWAHNPKYVLQILYDSIEDLGGDLTGLTRP